MEIKKKKKNLVDRLYSRMDRPNERILELEDWMVDIT